jgi:phosphoribosylanthranilate isomerase
VFVNQTLEEIIKIIDTTGIDTVQLHGSEQNYNIDFVEKLASKINLPIIYSIRIKSISDEIFYDKFFKEIQGLVGNILFDRLDNTELGGTGKVIFFDKERPLDKNFMEFISKKVIIAGGINKGNVKEIINFYKPYGIDVSSGVEKEKGVKDNNLIQEFLSLLKK